MRKVQGREDANRRKRDRVGASDTLVVCATRHNWLTMLFRLNLQFHLHV